MLVSQSIEECSELQIIFTQHALCRLQERHPNIKTDLPKIIQSNKLYFLNVKKRGICLIIPTFGLTLVGTFENGKYIVKTVLYSISDLNKREFQKARFIDYQGKLIVDFPEDTLEIEEVEEAINPTS